MMEFRYNEIITWLIHGLYLLCLLSLLVIPPFIDVNEISAYLNMIKEIPDGIVTSAALFFIPFVSFVIGYLINYIASQFEFWMYKFDLLKRPSRILLSGKSERYKLADLNSILNRLRYTSDSSLTNKVANDLLIKAKQTVDICSLDTYYFKTVFGRNLLCSQIFVTLGLIYDYFHFDNSALISQIISLVAVWFFFTSWRRNSKIYVKNIFSIYMKKTEINQSAMSVD